jgi:hypothetical protein
LKQSTNIIEQRNSTNAQTFRIYNTYTDASNYERGFMRWASNVLGFGTEKAGTGAARGVTVFVDGNAALTFNTSGEPTFNSAFLSFGNNVNFFRTGSTLNAQIGGGSAQWTLNSTGTFILSLGTTSSIIGPEISDPAAPAANTYQIYGRDDGSGKTQLCVRFATGAVQVLATEP